MRRSLSLMLVLLFCLSGAVSSAHGTTRNLGPFVLYSADSSSQLRLQFAAQIRGQLYSEERVRLDDRDERFTMKVRRARPGLLVSLLDGDLGFRVQVSTAPGSLELIDAYVNYRLSPRLQVRYGQFKIPFTRYRIQSFQRLTLTDWSLTSTYFGAERQMGLVLHNGYERPTRLTYAVGLFQGTNARASHALGLARVYGVKTQNPSDLSDPAPTDEFHAELVGYMAIQSEGMDVRSEADRNQGPFRYQMGFSAAWDSDPVAFHDFVLRLAPEGLIKYRGMSLAATGYWGYSKMGGISDTRLAMRGLLIQASIQTSQRADITIRYARVDITDSLTADVARMTEGAGSETFFSPKGITEEREFTLGCNVYFIEHQLKIQSDIGWLDRDVTDGDLGDVLLRSQIQIAF